MSYVRQTKTNRAGFSLIELLLVLVILAVLAAVVATRFTGRSEQARNTAARTDIASLETALDAFEIDAGRFPTSEEGLEALIEQPSGVQEDAWRGPYIKRGVPKDPWGNQYNYQQPGRHNTSSYDLSSSGPDGQAGTEDDIINWSEDDR
ncbi:type II secretion system major pseudopilin GspG [Planctomycetales bacterium ZRK34]|nr:type II secretion system major pseudopilin GspG [Planctomycetales bacterium ZRK34]